MQGIDFALATGVLKLPHPLFAYSVDLHGVGRWRLQVVIKHRRPHENHHGETQWNHRPDDFQEHRAVDLHRFPLRPFAVLDDEKQDEQGDQQGEKRGNQHQEQVERVHLSCDVRGLLRK